jgi:dinuclear metal center YbgI/SA1388 family protein
VSHHPIVFSGLKKITGKNYVERVIIKAIKNDIALYAIHTNLDNINLGVSHKMASILGLEKIEILAPKAGHLKKLYTTAPSDNVANILKAIFEAGGGQIGNYGACSFCINGTGSFTPLVGSVPVTGSIGEAWKGEEVKMEVLFPAWQQQKIIAALKAAHIYEEVAYEIIGLDNKDHFSGAGVIGKLPKPMPIKDFLQLLKQNFKVPVIKHTAIIKDHVERIALCGGSGSFLTKAAIGAKADVYITADVKYHEFYDADNQVVIADIGHYETEQFTIDLIAAHLQEKNSTFAVLKTSINTNSVNYF